jgi:hypothetical protein
MSNIVKDRIVDRFANVFNRSLRSGWSDNLVLSGEREKTFVKICDGKYFLLKIRLLLIVTAVVARALLFTLHGHLCLHFPLLRVRVRLFC